jgi:hypothetical protein
MTQGRHISTILRFLIFTMTVQDHFTASTVHHCLFHDQESLCSLDYLDRLKKKLLKSSTEDIALYLRGRSEDRSRKRKFTLIDDLLIRELNERNKDLRLRSLGDLYEAHTRKANPSESAVFRSLKISKVTRKKFNFQNLLACPIQKLAHMKTMAPFPAHHMINVDETSCSKKKFMVTHGRCASNEELVGLEWRIDGFQYSAIAAYSPHGFLDWRIYMEGMNHYSFEDFISLDLQPFVTADSILMFDGASIHVTDSTKEVVDRVTHEGCR